MPTARKGRKPKELSPGFAALLALTDATNEVAAAEAAAITESWAKVGHDGEMPPWYVLEELPRRRLFNRVVGTLATSRDYGDWPEGDRLRQLMFDDPDEYKTEILARWKAAFGVDPPMNNPAWVRFCGVVGIVAPDTLTLDWIETRLVPYIVGRYRSGELEEWRRWPVYAPAQLRKDFGVSQTSIAKQLMDGEIRNHRITSKRYHIHPDDVARGLATKAAREKNRARSQS